MSPFFNSTAHYNPFAHYLVIFYLRAKKPVLDPFKVGVCRNIINIISFVEDSSLSNLHIRRAKIKINDHPTKKI